MVIERRKNELQTLIENQPGKNIGGGEEMGIVPKALTFGHRRGSSYRGEN